MEGGSGRMQTSDKGVERLMDEFLKTKGFYRKKIAKDGSCLFRAVAEQVLRCQSRHTEVRATCVDYLKKNRTKYESFIEGNFEEYLHRLEDPQNWVGEVEISALALIYRHDFIIFQEPGKPPVNITENSFSDKVRLCFLNGNHYDSVYPSEFVNKAALCQSILYELLYEQVYGVDHGVVSACLRNSGDAGDDGYSECKSSEESDLEEEDEFWPSDAVAPTNMNNQRSSNSSQPSKTAKPPQSPSALSRRVQLSLNPALFRNVEYDVWLRSKRAQQKRDFCIAAGMQYTVGDKCKVRLGNTGKFYSAYIQEVTPDHGPVTVFIEELGEKHSVPLWNLRPSSSLDGDSWSMVAERGKRFSVSNGNGHHPGKAPRASDQPAGRDGRGGRRPGKSSPTPQGPAAGPPPRMHKQHSWPPPATAEEPGTEGSARTSTRSPDWGRNGCLQTKPPSDSTLKSQKASARAAFRKGETGPPGGSAQELHFGLSQDERLALEEQQKSQALLEIMQRDERSFPALASQGGARAPQPDTGRRTAPQAGERRAYRRKGDAPEPFQDGENVPRSAQKEENKLLTSAQPGCSSGAHSAPPHPPPEPSIAAAVTTAPPPAVSAPPPAVSAPPPAVSAPPPCRLPLPYLPLLLLYLPLLLPYLPLPQLYLPLAWLYLPLPLPRLHLPLSLPYLPFPWLHLPLPRLHLPLPLPRLHLPLSLPYLPFPWLHLPLPRLHLPLPLPWLSHLPLLTVHLPLLLLHLPTFQPHPPSQLPRLPLLSSPPPPPQPRDSAPPAGFLPASLPVEPPPYNGASPCPPGVMSQLGIAPGPPPTPPVLPEHLSHPHAHSPALPPQGPLSFHQMAQLYQDPLYPGFPTNDKDEMLSVPQYCYMRDGQDLPREIGVLRFFFNLGIKAYTYPSWPLHTYLYQLQQAHLSLQPKVSYMAPWYPEAPPPGPFRMNSVPMEGYGRPPSYRHATAGGRGPGQFEHAHCPVQPGVGVAMVGGAIGPQHTELGLGSDGRPPLGYSPQPPAPLQPYLGGMPWPGPRPNPAFSRAFSTPPPPPAPQYPPPVAQYPPPSGAVPPCLARVPRSPTVCRLAAGHAYRQPASRGGEAGPAPATDGPAPSGFHSSGRR
ncbi:OTU domain-containing protein 4 [Anguilla anguilla]|uniref:OTU domain-containing protein 4 n=1 Tax=Anguilla anguilla TaxID=7936 RepID=UPI0015A7D74E|nr:OTU domain-containing protein 4 [Anguilla anguilla]